MQSYPPILIHQMGKVGSSSIQASLKNLELANPVHHTHFLSWRTIQEVEEYYHGLPNLPFPEHILRSKQLRSQIDASQGKIRWKIVTLVRDPVARDISDLFENIERDLPHVDFLNEDKALREVKDNVYKMFQRFDETADYACCWFDKEILDVFGLDVYAGDFNKSVGYQIYEAENADILVLKLERLQHCYREAFKAFLDIEDFSLLKANVGAQKKYSGFYKKLLESICIPEADLYKIYHSRYSQHFYTGPEIDQFKKKWMGNGSDKKPFKPVANRCLDNRKKILVIHPEGNINNNPNLTGIVQILCENKCIVHICSLRQENIYQESPCDGATLLLMDSKIRLSTDGFVLLDAKALNSAENTIKRINEKIEKYDLIIGVDRGIIEASLIAQVQQVPYGLISYEIFFEEEAGRAFKHPERKACDNVSFAVCQDKLRASLLSIENNIPSEKILIVPVAGRSLKKGKKDFYLHNLLGIDKARKIALLIGSLGEWTMTNYLIESARSWPKDWALVIHSRYGLDQAALPYYEKFRKLDNVYFSLEPTAQPDQLYRILDSAAMGVALYKPLANDIWAGNNIKHIGMASGKIATYLQHGLPLIINEIGEMSDHVRNAGLGVVVDDSKRLDISVADDNLPGWRKNCFNFFEDKLDLNHTSIPLVKTIKGCLEIPSNGVASDAPKGPPPAADDRSDLHELKSASTEYWVSAVVSTYNAERFIRGCLEDLENQTIADRLEIVVVNSGSQQNEEKIIEEFQKKYPNIKYLKTKQRETVYAAWNRGIKAASGRYITNANTDDRHRRDALEIMARGLEENPEIGAVYADTLITDIENETFEDNTAQQYFHRPNFSLRQMLLFSFFGPQPMWRRSVHQKIGYFDASLSVAGDYDFFIRLAHEFGALHIAEILGLYTRRSGSIENSDRKNCVSETLRVLKHYRSIIPLEDIYPDLHPENESSQTRAACLADQGNCCLFGDLPDIKGALANYSRSFEQGYNGPELAANLAVINRCIDNGEPPVTGQFTVSEIRHPAVLAAIRGKGLSLEGNRFISIETGESHWVGSSMVRNLTGKTNARIKEPSEPVLVSVIVRTMNRPILLKECLTSLAAQTFKDFEVILINDGGENIDDMVEEYSQRLRILYKKNLTNKGRTAALNTGLKSANGKYIAYLDDDDLIYPNHIEILAHELEAGKVSVVYSDSLEVSQEAGSGTDKAVRKRLAYSHDFDRDLLRRTNYIPILNLMHRRDCVAKVGLFDENLSVLEDWDYWIRLSEYYDFKHILKVTAEYRVLGDNSNATASEAHNFEACRERIRAKLAASAGSSTKRVGNPLVSMVILTYNQIEYTQKCIDSILAHTEAPFEIIIVDNGSVDGTPRYLDTLIDVKLPADRLKVIRNKENKGFAAGNNQGIEAALGDCILLMNNDIVVTPGWLGRLVDCANRNPRIGITGPMSNYVSGPQQIEGVGYDTQTLVGLDRYAVQLAERYIGKTRRLMRVVGFCMLIKRSVIDKIGGLDDRYGFGNFEDDDFSLRAALAGFESWMAEDCFIHHFGSRTFIGAKIDYNESLAKNWEIFKNKWNLPPDLQLGARYNWAQILKKGFVRKKHYCPITQGNSMDAGQKAASSTVADVEPLKGLYQKVQRLVEDGRQEEAIVGLEKMLEIDPDFATAHNDLGILNYNQGDKEKALSHYEQAVRIEPHNLTFQKNLADFYFVESGRVEEALAIYNKVLEVDFGDVEALMSMGLICEALERPEDARHFYNRVLEAEPWNVEARRQMENLYPN